MKRTRPDALAVLTGALRIYSPSGKESKLAEYLASQMKALGYRKVRIDGAGNVLGEAGNHGPSVLLCGHMDTVPGRLPIHDSNGRLTGRGASDAKSPLCALLLAGAAARSAGVRVTFAGVTREETDSFGVRWLLSQGRRYPYAVFGEPGGASRITVGYRGRLLLRTSFKTDGGHASSPWANRSAFDEFTSFLSELRNYEASRVVSGDNFRSVSVTPTLVRSGSFHNVVPSTCEATLDVRIPPGASVEEVSADVRSMAKRHKSMELVVEDSTEPYQASPGSTLVRAFQRGVLISSRSKPVLVRKTGTGDMNTYSARTSAECVTYGPGSPTSSHSGSEYVEVDDYIASVKVAVESLKQLGRIAGGSKDD